MAEIELRCENCDRQLDPTDKFCRECGLPTVHRAQTQRQVPLAPPDTNELRRNLDTVPDPQPFLRPEPGREDLFPEEASEELTTGGIVQATNPTYAAKMASSTLLMVAVIVLLAAAGIAFLLLAFR